MRLIDADALMDEANSDGAYGYVDAKQISEAPTVDAVPLVRCRECKHYELNAMGEKSCFNDIWNQEFAVPTAPEDFCSYGERKGGAE